MPNKKPHKSAAKNREKYKGANRRYENKIKRIEKSYNPSLKSFSEKHLQELKDKVKKSSK